MYGRVVSETIGDPANGVGGTYKTSLFHTGPAHQPDRPAGRSDGDPIVFQCVVTDRNGNQTVYGFNGAQMPSRSK